MEMLHWCAWRCEIGALQPVDALRVLHPSHDAPRSLFADTKLEPGDEAVASVCPGPNRNFCGSLRLWTSDFLRFAGTYFCDWEDSLFLLGNNFCDFQEFASN